MILCRQEALVAALKAQAISKVVVSFAGSGDEGSLDTAEFFRNGSESVIVDNVMLCYLDTRKEWSSHVVVSQEIERSLTEALDDAVNAELGKTGYNWYDDSGGQGSFTLDVDANTVALTIELSSTTSQTEHASDCTIAEWLAGSDEAVEELEASCEVAL